MIENYTDIGASTPEAMKISRKSRELISSMIGDRSLEDRITQRCVIATGDPSVAEIMRFQNDPVQAGLKALERGAPIYVDIKMVQAGVLKKGHSSPIEAFIDRGDELAASLGITRTSAGVLALQEKLSGSIVVIGNAPSALLTLCELMQSGTGPARPGSRSSSGICQCSGEQREAAGDIRPLHIHCRNPRRDPHSRCGHKRDHKHLCQRKNLS